MKKVAEAQHNFHGFYRYNFFTELLLKYTCSGLSLDEGAIKKIKTAAEAGLVVYAIKHPSLLDCLAIYEIFKKERLPLPRYAHGISTIFSYGLRDFLKAVFDWLKGALRISLRVSARKGSLLRKTLERDENVIFHLGPSEHYKDMETETALNQMMSAQNDGKNIIIFPILVAYGRRREKKDENLLRIVFSQTEYTGPIRRLITFIRYARRVIIMAGEPVAFSRYVQRRDAPTEKMLIEIRRNLIEAIDKEKFAIVGPMLKSTKEITDSVLEDAELLKIIENISGGDEKKQQAALRTARQRLKEIAAGYDEIYVSFFDLFLTWLWHNIYDGLVVDREGLARIREIAKKMPFVVIPCHRSHIDYLIFSHVLLKNNLPVPFIAAGANMQFWPMGPIFRRCGAFFLRRSFQGDELYSAVFSKYIQKLIEEGIPLKFFIEGGRSRTGKMVMPKYGLLSMIIQAFQRGTTENLALIPVYLGYDRIVEGGSYLKELGGGEKTSERATDIIKSGGIIRKRYGRVYVNIGEPITLKEYFASLPVAFDGLSDEGRRALYRKIGYEVVLGISNVSVVTPFSMTAATLLSHDYRGISHNDLMDCLDSFRSYLEFRGVQLAESLAHESLAVKSAIQKFEEAKYISRISMGDEDEMEEMGVVYSLTDDKRLAIEYYKNNILHFFLSISFFALAALHHNSDEVSFQDILDDYTYLKNLFRHEFIFDDDADDTAEIRESMRYLSERGDIDIIEVSDGFKVIIRGIGRKNMERFAALTKNYLESYWIVVRSLAHLRKKPLPEKEFLKKTMVLGDMLFKKGEIRRAEALSNANYLNALRYLRERGLVGEEQRREKGEKRSVKYYSTSGDKATLESTRRDLFKFIM